MDIFAAAERLMRMDEESWARHANPLSVWSRFSCLPLIALAIWSRVWLGWWCLVPLAAALAWTFLNPRLFPPPERFDSWASRAVAGERLFLARKTRPIPRHHRRWALALTGVSALGLAILVHGLWVLDFWATLCGLSVAIGAKAWFCDRMVWLDGAMRSAEESRGGGPADSP